MVGRELQALVPILLRAPRDEGSWLDLAAVAGRIGGSAELAPLAPLRHHLGGLLRSSQRRLRLAPAMLALLGVEALPPRDSAPPAWWTRRGHRALEYEGMNLDPATGLPIRVRHRATGVELMLVEGGGCRVGKENHRNPAYAARRVRLRSFYLGRYPVTVQQLEAFYRSRRPELAGASDAPSRHPATEVDRFTAEDFCSWAGGRLPGEHEWERAARGRSPRRFPWGELRDREVRGAKGGWPAPTSRPGGPMDPVDAHPGSASPFGVEVLCGQVAEYCLELYLGRAPVRGGQRAEVSWDRSRQEQVWNLRIANLFHRRSLAPWTRSPRLGFRLCLPLEPGLPPAPEVAPPADQQELERLVGMTLPGV